MRCGSAFVLWLSNGAVRCCAVLSCVALCRVVWFDYFFFRFILRRGVVQEKARHRTGSGRTAPKKRNTPSKAPEVWGCVRIRQHFSSLNGHRLVLFHGPVYFFFVGVWVCVCVFILFFLVALRLLTVSFSAFVFFFFL